MPFTRSQGEVLERFLLETGFNNQRNRRLFEKNYRQSCNFTFTLFVHANVALKTATAERSDGIHTSAVLTQTVVPSFRTFVDVFALLGGVHSEAFYALAASVTTDRVFTADQSEAGIGAWKEMFMEKSDIDFRLSSSQTEKTCRFRAQRMQE